MSNKVNISEKPSIELIEMLNRMKERNNRRERIVKFAQKAGNAIICYACIVCLGFLSNHQELKFSSYEWLYWGGIFASGYALLHNLMQFLNSGTEESK